MKKVLLPENMHSSKHRQDGESNKELMFQLPETNVLKALSIRLLCAILKPYTSEHFQIISYEIMLSLYVI